MVDYKIENDILEVTLCPLYIKGKDFVYKLDKPNVNSWFIEFKTATSPMGVAKDENGRTIIEHLTVDGTMEWVPYKGSHLGSVNFFNYGWEWPQGRIYLRIDPYFGECKVVKEG